MRIPHMPIEMECYHCRPSRIERLARLVLIAMCVFGACGALALVLGQIVSGAVLVEVIFGYPGIGTMLYQAIRGSDYYLVQGIVFIVIISIGMATFILEIIYPLLDPRITYRKA